MRVHNHSFCPECGQALEGSEYLCPSCAFKLAEPPVEQTPPPPPSVENVPPPIFEHTPPPINDVVPPVPSIESPEPTTMDAPVPPVEGPKKETIPPVQEPVSQNHQQSVYNQATPPTAMPPKKKSKTLLWIVIILLLIIIIGGGAGAFLIYNGTIPKNKVDFLPKEVLEMLTPTQNNNAPVSNIPQNVYYLAYSFTLLEENNEKVIIISSVMDPGSTSQSNEYGAKSSFNEFARINYPDDYFLFKDVTVKQFNSREDAVNEREKLKKDYEKKGYTLRLMEVVYSIK